MTEIGTLVEVTETQESSSLAADVEAGDLLIPLRNSADFDAPGLCEVAGETYLYTEVTDDDELILDPLTPLLADITVDDDETPVYSLSDTGSREIIRYAWVQLDDEGDAAPAVISSGMRGYFRMGDVDAGSLVEVESKGTGYVVASRPVDDDSLDGQTVWNPHVARQATTNNIPDDTWEEIAAWTTLEVGGITLSGAKSIIERDGFYDIRTQIVFSSDPAGRRRCVIRVNGSQVAAGAVPADDLGGTYLQAATAMRLAPGDEVTVDVYQNSGGTIALAVGAGYTNFSMYRVSI